MAIYFSRAIICHWQVVSEALGPWKYSNSSSKYLSGGQEKFSANKENIKGHKDELILIFGGDVTFDGPVHYFEHQKCNYNDSFDKIKAYLADGDVIAVNLESPFLNASPSKYKFPKDNGVWHVAEPKAVDALE